MKKYIKVFAAVLVCGAAVLIFTVVSIYLSMIAIHRDIIGYVPDSSDWVLTTDKYDVVPLISEHGVRFYVEDKDGNTVYESDSSWRTWDFKSIDIDPSTYDIKAVSADAGEDYYLYDGKTWEALSHEGGEHEHNKKIDGQAP